MALKKPIEEIFPAREGVGVDYSQLDIDRIPQHVAIIMDGNGRWAKKRALNRLRGHKAGIEAVRETIRAANDLGVKYLTIYSFSTENWSRPKDEVNGLMDLFARTMLAEVDELDAEGVRVKTIGDISILPSETREAFEKAWNQTCENDGMTLLVAVNYGGRDEIVHACNKVLAQHALSLKDASNLEAVSIFAEDIEANLYTADIPDPEVIIRTSGEMRLSNFLLWQAAYSEFVVSDVLWPDFDRYEFLRCILEYMGRDRRFGGVRP
jgi:undecaprenyl diphosphate synthase